MPRKTDKDEIIISALLTTPTIKEAANVCGMSATQIYAHLRDPTFKRKYAKARLNILESNSAKLQHYISMAIDKIAEIIEDENNSPQVRLNACEAVIRNSMKLTEQVEILNRLEKLEEYQRNEVNNIGNNQHSE